MPSLDSVCLMWLNVCRSFFELMLFFSKEEFQEHPLKDILDSLQVRNNRHCISSPSYRCLIPNILIIN